MQLSNMRQLRSKTKDGETIYVALVDVTTRAGIWPFSKTTIETKRVFRRSDSQYWRFIDTHEFTPNFQMENLESKYRIEEMFGEFN